MSLPVTSRLLVHTCCCHCGAYTLRFFRDEGYAVSALWYNPNIHPFLEHEARRQALISLTNRFEIPLITVDGYGMPAYIRAVAGNENERCARCYEIRLSKTADLAIEQGFDAFSSSLLISPWQKHESIKATAERISLGKDIPFVYADLRKHYAESRHITKPLGLYTQQYCGCLYSEWERYRDKSALDSTTDKTDGTNTG
jgi:predicted adenine nucleotide alpha hydrolase (AANH) superfamily ATPase